MQTTIRLLLTVLQNTKWINESTPSPLIPPSKSIQEGAARQFAQLQPGQLVRQGKARSWQKKDKYACFDKTDNDDGFASDRRSLAGQREDQRSEAVPEVAACSALALASAYN